nr:hypothetical protein Iba_chr14dCG18930 [Ipomoea batatas]
MSDSSTRRVCPTCRSISAFAFFMILGFSSSTIAIRFLAMLLYYIKHELIPPLLHFLHLLHNSFVSNPLQHREVIQNAALNNQPCGFISNFFVKLGFIRVLHFLPKKPFPSNHPRDDVERFPEISPVLAIRGPSKAGVFIAKDLPTEKLGPSSVERLAQEMEMADYGQGGERAGRMISKLVEEMVTDNIKG